MIPKVLIVEDEKVFRDAIQNELSNSKVVDPIIVESFDAAMEAARQDFFLLVCSDMVLKNPHAAPCRGDELLTQIARVRPTAKRIIVTAFPQDMAPELIKSCDPIDGAADGIWLSADRGSLGALIEEYVTRNGLARTLRINSLDAIFKSLRPKIDKAQVRAAREHKEKHILFDQVALTPGEVHYVIARLLSTPESVAVQYGGFLALDTTDTIEGIDLVEMTRGKSLSCVFKGRPRTRLGHDGILCIIKLGPRGETAEEIAAYERYVRFARHAHARVESLSHVLGDAIGGICYSFAGIVGDGSDVISLQDILEAGIGTRESEAADCSAQVLRMEFNPSQKEWYRKEEPSNQLLTDFFVHAYTWNPLQHALHRTISEDFGGNDSPWSGYVHSGKLHIRDASPIPLAHDELIARVKARFPRYRSCIVHGDMNAENLLVSLHELNLASTSLFKGELRAVIPIDYRMTQRGPVFLDFAALEVAVRCTGAQLDMMKQYPNVGDLLDVIGENERRLLKEAWQTDVQYEVSREGIVEDRGALWNTLAFELVQLARGNFGRQNDKPIDLKTEYVATCLLYGLRVLRIRGLYSPRMLQAKARVLKWVSVLMEFLEHEIR